MTPVQWYWEFLALREKEKDEVEKIGHIMTAFRRMLVNVLGLDLLRNKSEEGEDQEDTEEDLDSFVPLSLMAGRREVIEHILKGIEEEQTIEMVENDEAFEELSASIAAGDMDPILNDPALDEAVKKAKQVDMDKQMAALGIKKVSRADSRMAHIDLDVPKMKERIQQDKLARARSKQQIQDIEEQVKKEQADAKRSGVKITFDDENFGG